MATVSKEQEKCCPVPNTSMPNKSAEEVNGIDCIGNNSLEVNCSGQKCSSDFSGSNSFSSECSPDISIDNNKVQETLTTSEDLNNSKDSFSSTNCKQLVNEECNCCPINENKQLNIVKSKCKELNKSDVFSKKEDSNIKRGSFAERKLDSCDGGPENIIKENKLVTVMKEITLNTEADALTSLSLVGLGLKSVDYDFSLFVNVSCIDLSNNELSCLPDSFIHLKQCTRLNISKNKFTEVPAVLYKDLYFIQSLDLSFNAVKEFNLAPLCVSYLVSLNASHNKLVSPPLWIVHDIPSSLKSLNISFNPCFKDKLSQFFYCNFNTNAISSRLTELDVSCTGFTSANLNVLKMFPCLRVLRMDSNSTTMGCCNSIDELPGNILDQMPLEVLNVEGCNLTCLPDNMDKLYHLKVLQVANNNLSWFPERLAHLDCLSVVVASKCQLVYLPKDMGYLTSLTELWLSYNDISSLPDMKNCKNLKVLDLYCNSFTQLPDTVSSLKLEAFDVCCNYFSPAAYKQPLDGVEYEKLKTRLRGKLNPSESRLDSIRIDYKSRDSSYSGSYSSSSRSWGSYRSSKSRKSTSSPSSLLKSFGSNSKEDESWDVDPDDAWDPELYNNMRKWTSDDSLSRCRFLASMTKRENFFCPHQERSSFYQNLYVGYTGPDEQGQFEDA